MRFLLILSIGMIIGLPFRACAFLNASVMMGELSVRMVVPIDMKKLGTVSAHRPITAFHSDCIPKCGRRTKHVLTQRPHHAVRTRAVSDDIGRAEDESDDEPDSCHPVNYSSLN